MASIPPPPPGVTLDGPPPPPPGVTIDSPDSAAQYKRKLSPGDQLIANTFGAVGRGGKKFNDLIQNLIGSGVDKVGEKFPSDSLRDRGIRTASAYYGTIPATSAEASLPKNAEEAAALMLPMTVEPALSLAGKGARTLGSLAEGAVETAGKTVSGRTPQAFEMLRSHPDEVLAEARKGMTLNGLTQAPEPVALGEAQAAGRNAQGIIEDVSSGASKEYGQMMEHLKSPEVNGRLTPVERGPYDPPMRGGSARSKPNLKEIPDSPHPGDLFGQPAESPVHGLGGSAEGPSFSGAGEILPTEYTRTGGDRFDVADKVSSKIEPFLETQTSYKSASQSPRVKSDSGIFNGFYDRIKATASGGATPGEVADLLQQMTQEQKAARGMPLSAHLAELKNALLDALPGDYKIPTVDTPTPGGWSIKDTRDSYKAAKSLQRDLKPFTNPQNPIAALRSVARAGGDASVSLKNAIEKIPALKAALEKMNISSAGAEFAPKMGELPRTGLTGSTMQLVSKLLRGDISALPATTLYALGASPRMTAETLVAGRKAGAAVMNSARGAESKVPALLAAYLRRKKD